MQNTLERKQIKSLDFNCDLAQSFGVYKNTAENALLDYVTSVNVSCGFHAGDPLSIKNALMIAKEKGLVIGAHIGFDDIQGFGYRPVSMSAEEIEALVVYQVGALMSFAQAYNLEIEHVRLHGAMYKQASADFEFACNVARAIQKCSKWLVYYGAAGDITQKVAELIKIPVAQEIQLDLLYNPDLTVDTTSVITDSDRQIRRLQQLLRTSQIDNNQRGLSIADIDSIHFANKYENSLDIVRRAFNVISPEPVNYIKAKASGWVG